MPEYVIFHLRPMRNLLTNEKDSSGHVFTLSEVTPSAMPAMLDDPTAPAIYRVSGSLPYPTPQDNQLPDTIFPRQVTLRDRITIATLIPFSSSGQVPPSLLSYLADQFNREILKGDTYPMISPLPLASFGSYWFQNFGAVMILGEVESVEEVREMERSRCDWTVVCLGSFYVKPNYPGRSSHVCNGGFLVTDAARNKGVGRLMGEGYLEWAPKLGYTYSVFNLVYETNVASCRIWDALGFKRIGRVKGCGNLRSHPNELIDAIIYGRDLGPEGEDFVSEERFDKIRFYLKHGKYPNGADRAEKSRLRSAATHYKLLPAEDGSENERLMLKDKEVVADPQRQYEIARQVHAQAHGGINKTTATIAEKFHWVRIKETVSLVIKNCPDCKDIAKVSSSLRPENGTPNRRTNGTATGAQQDPNSGIERLVTFEEPATTPTTRSKRGNRTSPPQRTTPKPEDHTRASTILNMQYDIPLDPQIMQDIHHPSSAPSTFQNQRRRPGDRGVGIGAGVGLGMDMKGNSEGQGQDVGVDMEGAAETEAYGMDIDHTHLATETHVRDGGGEPMAYRIEEGIGETEMVDRGSVGEEDGSVPDVGGGRGGFRR